MLHSWMGITSNYSLMNEGDTYTTEQIRRTEATLSAPTVLSMAQHVKDQLVCKIRSRK